MGDVCRTSSEPPFLSRTVASAPHWPQLVFPTAFFIYREVSVGEMDVLRGHYQDKEVDPTFPRLSCQGRGCEAFGCQLCSPGHFIHTQLATGRMASFPSSSPTPGGKTSRGSVHTTRPGPVHFLLPRRGAAAQTEGREGCCTRDAIVAGNCPQEAKGDFF